MMRMLMGKRLALAISLLSITVFTESRAFAGFQVNQFDTLIVSDGPGGGIGGEYRIDVLSNGAGEDFRTFCVQLHQTLIYGELLTVAALSQKSEGNSGTGGTQFLTARASALYREFLRGQSLAGNTANSNQSFLPLYGSTTYKHNGPDQGGAPLPDDGLAMQNAIWFYQGQLAASSVAGNKFVTAVEALATARGWSAGLLAYQLTATDASLYGGVDILNLRRIGGVEAQDILAYGGPDLIIEIPEPSAFAIFGLGFLTFVVRGLRKSTASTSN